MVTEIHAVHSCRYRTSLGKLRRCLALLAITTSLPIQSATTDASPKLEGIACRSVHLQLKADEGTAFYNEVTVQQSQEGTYFCVCGFHRGYYGIQELPNGKKLLIFSVWDPGQQNDPNVVDPEYRVKLLYQDKDVRVGRFGNEGTGGQSFYDYDWQVGQTYRFLVTSKVNETQDRTAFAAYFYLPEEKSWKHLVTFDRPTQGEHLRGYYSFVEDFRRNRISATRTRTASFGNAWVRDLNNQWHAIESAKFTADGNPVLNIDAGVAEPGRFFLSTGGDITNDHVRLNETIRVDRQPDVPSDVIDVLEQ